ncbi:MAG TPA: hypothetical protein DCO79_00150 [Spirochaeta sp.]|nr:hypothetical protein [Spirochaeta sp.]
MKLSIRALLFFIGVVVFQSALTIMLVTGIITRSNENDVRVELSMESGAVYEEYNSWLRTLWKTTIRINNDNQYIKLIEDHQMKFSKTEFDAWFKEIQLLSDIDSIIMRIKEDGKNEYFSSGSELFPSAEMEGLESVKDHPYLELREIGKNVYMTGNLGHNEYLDVFILKKIDEKFYRGSGLPERTAVYFVSENDLRTGRLLNDGIFNILQTSKLPDVPYKEVYDLALNAGNYNVSFQELGMLRRGDAEDKFYLILLMSNEPFLSILGQIYNALFIALFTVGFFAIILSFYFSRNITKPISSLLYAMEGIRGGDYKVKVDYKSGSEVGELFRGFNDMAWQIDQNKKSMENFIHEITFLKDYNEKIIYSLRAGILVVDNDLSIEKVNSFFLELFQCDAALLLNEKISNISIEVIDKAVLGKIEDVILGRIDSWSKIKRTEGFVFEIKLYLLFTNAQVGERKCVLEIDDVGQKYELEEKIFQAEKLASLSMLSAGVSHEINNPLSSILTNVQNLLDEDNDDETRTALSWIEQETRRIAKIVSDLLNFSAAEQGESEGSEVNTVISDVLKLINYGLVKEKRIDLSSDFQENLPFVVISRSELKQVVINLVQNSIYAIADMGKILVTTRLSDDYSMIHVQIIDSGVGMDEETMQHVFDPFFTTRTNGKGTGLGLSIVYGIISKYSGTIDVKSTVGSGTTILLSLPVRNKQQISEQGM